MALRLGFDVDGVVADFDTAFRTTCRQVLRTDPDAAADPEPSFESIGSADLKRVWKKIISAPNWWTTVPAYEPAQIARLYELSRRQKWQVFFLTKRPQTEGDSVQFQTQWWLEAQGFYLPSVATVPSSRGEMANALHLDLVVDDQLIECADVISSSVAKAVLMLRDTSRQNTRDQATARGIGVVSTLEEAVDVVERLQEVVSSKRSTVARLTDWFSLAKKEEPLLPMNPRKSRPLPADHDPPKGSGS